MQPRLSIIIPTTGGESLYYRTLSSLLAQVGGWDPLHDEVIIVGDGHQPKAERYATLARGAGLPHCRYVPTVHTADWGNAQRQQGMNLASGDYLLFMDDDDLYSPTSIGSIKHALRVNPGRPHVFRMQASDGRLIWTVPQLEIGNVSTQMICVPNLRRRLGVWAGQREGDFHFLASTLALYPDRNDALVWRDEVIVTQWSK